MTAPSPAERSAYEAARKEAGRDAEAQVRLALWCERHGMTAERMKHLAAAVVADPANALARGLMGLVAHDGKWERPEDVSREAKEDPRRKALMQEYLDRRAKAADRADDQWKLASWCEQNGLKEQAVAHYHAVVRLDPRREAVWKHLGFKKVGGRWVKPEWQEAARREADEQERANKHWRPLLERWRSGLSSREKSRARGRGSRPARRDRPPGRADGLGGLGGPGLRGAQGRGAGAGPDRVARLVAGPRLDGPQQPGRGGPEHGDRHPAEPGPPGLRPDAGRIDPGPDPVRGPSREGPGVAGRAPDQAPGRQRRPPLLAATDALYADPGGRLAFVRRGRSAGDQSIPGDVRRQPPGPRQQPRGGVGGGRPATSPGPFIQQPGTAREYRRATRCPAGAVHGAAGHGESRGPHRQPGGVPDLQGLGPHAARQRDGDRVLRLVRAHPDRPDDARVAEGRPGRRGSARGRRPGDPGL